MTEILELSDDNFNAIMVRNASVSHYEHLKQMKKTEALGKEIENTSHLIDDIKKNQMEFQN